MTKKIERFCVLSEGPVTIESTQDWQTLLPEVRICGRRVLVRPCRSDRVECERGSIPKLGRKIKKVMFCPPYTVILWLDGSRTEVKCTECGEGMCEHCIDTKVCKHLYDAGAWKQGGLMNALLKAAYGNEYLDAMREWLK